MTSSALPLPPSPLAIVGASARAAAFSAHRAGFAPVTADLFADDDLRRLCPATRVERYPDDFLPWLRDTRPAAWMVTGALENYPELVDAMAGVAPLWGNAGDVLCRVRSPWQLADALREASLLFPETRSSPDGLPRDGSWLAKTYRGASGSGVSALLGRQGDMERRRPGEKTGEPVSPCLLVPLSPCPVYQHRIAGETYCAVYVASNGAASLLGVTRQLTGQSWLGADEFQYCGSIGLWPVGDPLWTTITRIGNVLAERFALRGLFGVDAIVDDDRRVWTIEVNPRYTASVEIVERSTGVHAIAAHVDACSRYGVPSGATRRGACDRPAHSTLAEPVPPDNAAPLVHGKAILFATQDLAISAEFADWALEQALAKPWPSLADVPPAGTAIPCGRPILTLFADGSTPAEVEQRLQFRAADIENRLCTPSGTRR